jgi:hypothetical protein
MYGPIFLNLVEDVTYFNKKKNLIYNISITSWSYYKKDPWNLFVMLQFY